MFTDINPVVFAEFAHRASGRFAGLFEVVVPNGGNGFVVIIPEFTFLFGAVSALSRVARVDGVGFAVFVKKIRKTNFEKDVIFFDVFLESFFVFDDGVFECDTVWTNEIGVDDEVIFGVETTHSCFGVPDFFGIVWFARVHAGDDGGDNDYNYGNNAEYS